MKPIPILIGGIVLVVAGVLQILFRGRIASFFSQAQSRLLGKPGEAIAKRASPAGGIAAGVICIVAGLLALRGYFI